MDRKYDERFVDADVRIDRLVGNSHDKEYHVYAKNVRMAKTRTKTSLLIAKAATKTMITLI
jgi:hypothetical protein